MQPMFAQVNMPTAFHISMLTTLHLIEKILAIVGVQRAHG